MKTNDKHIAHPSTQQLQSYLAGSLTHAQSHQVERHLLACTYCSEALEGFEALKKQNIDYQWIEKDLKQLLGKRINKKPVRKLISLWQYAAAASVLLAIGFWWFLPKNSENKQAALSQITAPKPVVLADSVFEKTPEVAVAPMPKKQKANAPAPSLIPVLKEEELVVAKNRKMESPVYDSEVVKDDLPKPALKKAEEAPLPVTEPTVARMSKAAPAPAVRSKNSEQDDLSGKNVATQTSDKELKKSAEYDVANHEAMPSVGWDEFQSYLTKNKKQIVDSQIIIECTVAKAGTLSNFKIIKSQDKESDGAAIQLMKDGPKWIPKMVNGTAKKQKVQVKF